MSGQRRGGWWLWLPGVLCLAAGCTQLDVRKSIPWMEKDEDKVQIPDKVVAVWTDTVLYDPERPATRGFGGRLMFYTNKQADPIKVEGTLVVYAFEEANRRKGDNKPDRKYLFTPEQLTKHYSKSGIGHSYSVWIPWDEAGGPQTDISLIVRFMPKKGSVIVGEQSTHILPGATPEAAPATAAAQAPGQPMLDPAVQPASFETPAGQPSPQPGAEKPRPRMHTEVISVPRNCNLRNPSAAVSASQDRSAWQASRGAAVQAAMAQGAPQDSTPPQGWNGPAWANRPPNRSAPAQSQAPSERFARPRVDRRTWPPRHAGLQSDPEAQPQAASGS